ncbi:MAG TPA: MFS transporter [Bryobacteraceae bacterium]|nr:MFS transporter [Bryobacteraceae bacterium]
MTSGQQAQTNPAAAADEGLPVRTRERVTRRLIPYLMFIYFLAYLDRANIGVAKLQMQKDLNFNDAVIGFGAGIFFLGYLLLDIPGSLIVERWSARKWIARIMVSWGLVAALMGFVGTPLFGSFRLVTQFYGLRLLLGIAEAGFFPGVIVYLSHWYKAEDRSRAKAYFMITQPLAVAIGIPLSRWILDNARWAGLPGWRWVFFLEGIPPALMGLVTLFFLTDRPHQARWLPEDEKQWLIGELRAEEARKVSTGRVRVTDALRLPQTYLLIAVFFLIVTGNQALIFFLPSITDSMKSLPAALRAVAPGLPYACSAMGILLNGMWAHRTGQLRWHTAIPMLATGTSLCLAVLAGDRVWLKLGMFCLAGFTSQAYLPAFFTLPTTILGKSAAATAVGLICLGNLGGLAGPWLFGYLRTITGRYDAGLWVLAGCMLLAGTLATQIRAAHARGAAPIK